MFKSFKNRKEGPVADFQPDAIWLESRPVPLPAQTVWLVIFVLLTLGILWTFFAKVDKIVTAEGRLVTVRQNITMKPLERTIIKTVHVQTGERVKAGQILFTFDPTINQADLERLQEQKLSLKAQLQRLQAEENGIEFVTPPELKKSRNYELQQLLFQSRRLYFQEKVKTYDTNIRRYKETIDSMMKSVEKYIDRQDKVNEIEKMLAALREEKVISVKEHLNTQIQVIGMELQIDEQRIRIAEYEHQIAALEAEKQTFLGDWRRTRVEEMVNIERELISVEKNIPKSEMLTEQVELRAPCDAVVHEIAPFPEGSAVREAESLITLVPIGVPMEAEVDIQARDIGTIKLGDTCRLKFDAFPFQQNGTLDGKVRNLSQDAFTRSTEEARSGQGAPGSYYRARILYSGDFTGKAKGAVLTPGMRLVAEIKVGERSVISYIINPLIKALDESIREP